MLQSSAGSCPSGQRNRMMMLLASVLGSGPRAGLCSGPSWGPHSRSGPAPPRLLTRTTRRWRRHAQEHDKAAISFSNQSAINVAAGPSVTSRQPWCSTLVSQSSPSPPTPNSWTEPCLTVVFIPSAYL